MNSVNMPSEFSEPLEYYSELSGFYEGSTGQSSLSISIYTSWEETSIGTVGMNVDDEWYYLGEIIPESEKDVYLVETDTGEEVVLYVHSGYGAYLDYGIYEQEVFFVECARKLKRVKHFATDPFLLLCQLKEGVIIENRKCNI